MRMNISLSEDLKARMDDVEQPVNWSKVAQRAFEAELVRIQSIQEASTIDATVERLRASRLVTKEDQQMMGQKEGRMWAMQRAKYEELKRIAEYQPQREDDDGRWFEVAATAMGCDEYGEPPHVDQVIEWWDEIPSDCERTDAYAVGFAEGAQEAVSYTHLTLPTKA